MIRKKIARWTQPLTVIGGTLITIVSVWLLGVLNARAITTLPAHAQVRTVLLRGPDATTQQSESQPEESPPEEQPPEVMEVELDVPVAEPITPEPLELEIELPSPTIVPLQVQVEQPETQPSPQPPPTPAPRESASKPTAAKRSSPPAAQSAGRVDQPPRESGSNPPPVYPVDKLQNNIEGVVTLRLLIDEQGEIEDVKVVSGDEAFVRAVLAVVYRWRFTPAMHQGQPVKVWGLKKVRFNLRGGY